MSPLLRALVEGSPAPNAGDSPLSPPKANPVARLSYTHEAMIDLIIAEPAIYNEELAARFGYSPSWISTVVVSDIFQAKLAARREALVDPELRMSIKTQFKGLLERSMEILARKLDRPALEVPDQLAVQVAKLAGTSLGFGVKETKVSVTETHLHLQELGANLVDILRTRKAEASGRTFDGEAKVLADNSGAERGLGSTLLQSLGTKAAHEGGGGDTPGV